MADEPTCAVHVQSPFVQTAPGIQVRRRSRPCGKPATWRATWTDRVWNPELSAERPDVPDLVDVERQTYACDEHHAVLELAPELLVDSRGHGITAAWTTIETGEGS